MRYVGLDVHKHVVQVCVLDEQGNRVWQRRIDCTREALENFARSQLNEEDRLALEVTTNTWAVVEILEPFVERIVVGNPLKTKAIAEAKIKTDKVDAEVLAQLLRCDYLPTVWCPDGATRQLRKLTIIQAGLNKDRTRIKNRLHAILAQRLIKPPMATLFSQRGMQWLREVDLPEDDRLIVDGQLAVLDSLDRQLEQLNTKLAKLAHQRHQVRLLMTLPGVDFPCAQALWAAIGDLERFQDGEHLASYLGLVPSTYQSAKTQRHGSITKAGRGHARWMLTQAAQHLDRHPGPLGGFFRRLARRKNRNVAATATARKLVNIAYLMLKNNEPYRYALPEPTQRKLATLDRRAGAPKRRYERVPGIPRQRCEPGTRARNVRSLPQVYERHELPEACSPEQLSAGESRILNEQGATEHHQQIQSPQRKITRRG